MLMCVMSALYKLVFLHQEKRVFLLIIQLSDSVLCIEYERPHLSMTRNIINVKEIRVRN